MFRKNNENLLSQCSQYENACTNDHHHDSESESDTESDLEPELESDSMLYSESIQS